MGTPSGHYPVTVGTGLLAQLPDLMESRLPAPRYAVISDSNVMNLYGAALTERLRAVGAVSNHDFPEGEESKTRDTWARLSDELLNSGLGRDGVIVAVGGGVVGDLAGFVAATYFRGIRYVQVPTTLLAMVDSSVGGKTAIDTSHGKNLVGAFHQPSLVIADLETLLTLPLDHLRAGSVEAFKHGAVADAEYFHLLRSSVKNILDRDLTTLRQMVVRSVEIKSDVVTHDERETGRRAILNFGHTVAHAIESASEFQCLHGIAVGLGMVVEALLGRQMGLTPKSAVDALRDCMTELGILDLGDRCPTDPERILGRTPWDKKSRSGEIRCALISELGRPARDVGGEWTVPVEPEALETAIRGAFSTSKR